MKRKYAWITWESQQRNQSMAKLISADYFEIISNKNKLARYYYCAKETRSVFKKGYETIFVQNPSVILSLLAIILKVFYSKNVVIDAHNAGVFPLEGKYDFLNYLNSIILKKANLVIVTNNYLVDYLKMRGIKSIAITDPLPDYEDNLYSLKRDEDKVFVICSWAEDEPIELYFELAKEKPDMLFLFSGNYKKYNFENLKVPENIVLLGFISKEEYIDNLFTSLCTIDLTLRENCLVCGAYESISAITPVILTDNIVNKEVFKDSAIYSCINLDDLKNAVEKAYNFDREKIKIFREKYKNELSKKLSELENNL